MQRITVKGSPINIRVPSTEWAKPTTVKFVFSKSEEIFEEIARALRVPTTSYTSKDKEELIKRLQHERSVKAVIQPSNSTDPGALTRPSSGHSSDPKIEKMIQQVKDVFPQVPYDTIRKDIAGTKSVDTTLTNILEGKVKYSPLNQEQQEQEKEKLSKEKTATQSQPKTESRSEYSQLAEQRHLSFQERKRLMIEDARRRYLEKHPEYLPRC